MSYQPDMKVTVKVDPDWKKVGGLLADVVKQSALNVEKRAKEKVTENGSVRTGNMRSSIRINQVDSQGLEIEIGPTMEYAPFVEFGTIYFKGKPFMIPSLKAEKKPFIDAVSQVMDKLK